MLIMSLGCLQFSRESCLLYAFLLGYLPSIFCDFGEKPIDFYLQDSFVKFRFACSIKFILFAFKLAGGEQHFMLFADGKSTRDSRFSGARGCSHLDGTK